MIPPKRITPAEGARTVIGETPSRDIAPERIVLAGETYWMAGANGSAVVSITPKGASDPRDGCPAIMLYRDRDGDRQDGLALIRTFTPDEADEFADELKAWAARIRDTAAERAAAALRKAAGK